MRGLGRYGHEGAFRPKSTLPQEGFIVFTSVRRRSLAATAATALLALALLLALVPTGASAQEDVTPARVAGDDRVDTAAEVAELTYPEGTPVALVARADDYPDAMASAALAGQVDAPVLLTETDELPPRTAQTLETLGVTDIFVLGGTAAVSETVFDELLDLDYTVERLGGATRYETAAAIAAETVDQGPTNELVGDARTVFIAFGGSFEDALAAGAPASAAVIPTLLTEHDELPQATVDAIGDLDLEYAYVLGGELAVSQEVVAELEALGMGTQRIAGQTAQGTAAAIANEFDPLLEGSTAVLARGDLFADALAAGPHAGEIRGPILLTVDPETLGETTRQWFSTAPATTEAVRAIGGTAAISTDTLDEAVELVESDRLTTEQTYLVAPQTVQRAGVPGAADFSVARRYDDQPITAEVLDVALLPCETTDIVGEGTDTFSDVDGDGIADGFGATDNANAAIAALNGRDVDDEDVKNDVIVRDGRVTWRVASVDGPDCATTVVFDDVNGNGQLDVGGSDVGEVAVEPYGVGQVVFED